MADIDEPQYTSLAERIAALNRQKNFQSPPTTAGKRPPPPPPPNRPTPKTGNNVNGNRNGHSNNNGNGNSNSSGTSPLPTPTRPGIPLQKSPTVPARLMAAAAERDSAPPLPRRTTTQSTTQSEVGASDKTPPLPGRNLAPPLPSRRPSQSPLVSQPISPALPPRRSSNQRFNGRRNSNESDISYVSTISTLSLNQTSSATSNGGSDGQPQPARRLAPAFDQANLPPLPPTRRELEAKAKEAAANGTAATAATTRNKTPINEPPRPSLPPRLPSRPAARSPGHAPSAVPDATPTQQQQQQQQQQHQHQNSAASPRRLPPPPASYLRSPPTQGASRPKPPTAVAEARVDHDVPPPIPLASRPTAKQIEAVASRAAAAPSTTAGQPTCLVCRDFSAQDAVAAQHPISSLPRHDVAGYLARVLCDPFPSLTDKARAIFTWCHHNIDYDVHGFFNKCIPRGLTPDQTILSGKAVCEGYAKVYQAVAQRAGLECVVVGGHGKGYGFTPVRPGDPPPPRDATGHAWNAVRLDDGRWRLLDACWGAGHLGAGNTYSRQFSPLQFTLANELFGLSHFPSDARHFHRDDGSIPSWEEYVLGPVVGDEPAQWYNDARDEGLSEHNFQPAGKHIRVGSGETVRFQFAKVCEHWTTRRHGRGKEERLLILKVYGAGGLKDDLVPLETDGFWWWIDVPAAELGRAGQTVSVFALDTLDGRDASGVKKDEFLRGKGRVGMSWVGIAAWELV